MKNVSVYSKTNRCCGCGACSNICPQNAITMKSDDKGFLYPEVDMNLCVNCGLCVNVCAFNKETENKNTNDISVYAAKNKDNSIRSESRSGGVFTALTDKCIDNQGAVYGVALNDNFEALHKRAVTKEERNLFRGSKYIQSNVGDSYQKVKQDLLDGKEVIFSGTPCQVNAMKQYLKGIDCSKLILIDIVCHGVPSVRIWKDYLESYKKSKKGNITKVDFRNKKKYGWAASKETIWVDGTAYDNDLFINLFNSGVIERESCFVCPYKSLNRVGDITIGDFWGINKVNPEFNDNKGVSLVLCNTDKGKAYYQSIESKMESIKVNVKDCIQPAVDHVNAKPKDLDLFWKMYNKFGQIRFAKLYQYKLKIMFKLKHLKKK